jgi:hypothetical protein
MTPGSPGPVISRMVFPAAFSTSSRTFARLREVIGERRAFGRDSRGEEVVVHVRDVFQ